MVHSEKRGPQKPARRSVATVARPLRPLVAIAPHPTTDAAAAAAASEAKQTGVTPKPQCSFFSAC